MRLGDLVQLDPQGVPFQQAAPPPVPYTPEPSYAPPPAPDNGNPLAMIEQLAALRQKGILTDEEFAAKKAELLSRL